MALEEALRQAVERGEFATALLMILSAVQQVDGNVHQVDSKVDFLTQELRDHMKEEEGEAETLNAKLESLISRLSKVEWSMPDDAHGNPSPYIHKNQHGEDRRGMRRVFGMTMQEVRLLFIGAFMVFLSGNGGAMIEAIVKLVGGH